MDAESVIQTLSALGCAVAVSGENLVVQNQAGLLTDELREAIRANKPGIIALLAPEHLTSRTVPPGDDPRPQQTTEAPRINLASSPRPGHVVLTNRASGESAEVAEADLPKWFVDKVNAHRGSDWQLPEVPDHRAPSIPQHVMGGMCLQCGTREGFDPKAELCAPCLAAEPWARSNPRLS